MDTALEHLVQHGLRGRLAQDPSLLGGARPMRKWHFAAVLSLLSGCSLSPPVHFYTLDPVESPLSVTARESALVQVVAVHLPSELDRRLLVAQTAPNSLTISEQDRWGAPLEDMFRRVLTQNLIQRVPQGQVIMPEGTAPNGTKLIAIDILKFQREPSGTVVLDGSWTVSHAGSDDPGMQHTLELKSPVVQEGAAAQAHAMSQLVGLLADTIAAEYSR
jgi:uncharacterized lipoprotein YmbA